MFDEVLEGTLLGAVSEPSRSRLGASLQALKGLYLAYARGAKAMTRPRLARVVLLSSCLVDLCGADPAAAYQHVSGTRAHRHPRPAPHARTPTHHTTASLAAPVARPPRSLPPPGVCLHPPARHPLAQRHPKDERGRHPPSLLVAVCQLPPALGAGPVRSRQAGGLAAAPAGVPARPDLPRHRAAAAKHPVRAPPLPVRAHAQQPRCGAGRLCARRAAAARDLPLRAAREAAEEGAARQAARLGRAHQGVQGGRRQVGLPGEHGPAGATRPAQEGPASRLPPPHAARSGQALFLLAEHLHGLAYDVSFPELIVPTLAALKRVAKATKIVALQQRARRLSSLVRSASPPPPPPPPPRGGPPPPPPGPRGAPGGPPPPPGFGGGGGVSTPPPPPFF